MAFNGPFSLQWGGAGVFCCERTVMHMSRITGKYWGILLIAVAGWQGMGCDNKPAMTDNAVVTS